MPDLAVKFVNYVESRSAVAHASKKIVHLQSVPPNNIHDALQIHLILCHILQFIICTGFPRGIEKVYNFKIGFQDLEKVLNFAKKHIRY